MGLMILSMGREVLITSPSDHFSVEMEVYGWEILGFHGKVLGNPLAMEVYSWENHGKVWEMMGKSTINRRN
jgi:hypothetical protein